MNQEDTTRIDESESSAVEFAQDQGGNSNQIPKKRLPVPVEVLKEEENESSEAKKSKNDAPLATTTKKTPRTEAKARPNTEASSSAPRCDPEESSLEKAQPSRCGL